MKKMFYNLCRPLLATLLAASVLTACTDNKTEPTPEPIPTTPLEKPIAEASDVTTKSFVLQWAPVENAAVYGYSVSTDDTRGGAPEKDLLYTPRTAILINNLKEGTKYVVRIKAVSEEGTEYGDSEFQTLEVVTAKIPDSKEMFQLSLDKVIPTGFTCTIVPDDSNIPYLVVCASKAAVDQKGSPEIYMDEYIASKGGIDWSKEVNVDMDDPQAVKKGAYVYKDHANLKPERQYVLMVRGGDKNKIEYNASVAINTTAIVPVDCDFQIDVKGITYNRFEWSITPTDQFVSYAYEMVEAARFGNKSDQEIINTMMAANPVLMASGVHAEKQSPYMKNDTEYGIYVVGCIQRLPTTGLTKKIFKTKPLDFKKLDGEAYTDVQVQYVKRGTGEDSRKYVTVQVKMTRNHATAEYRVKIVPYSYVDGKPESEAAKLAIKGERNEWYPMDIYIFDTNSTIFYDQDYAVLVLSEDAEGNFGKVTIHKFHTTEYSYDGGTPEAPEGGSDGDDSGSVV